MMKEGDRPGSSLHPEHRIQVRQPDDAFGSGGNSSTKGRLPERLQGQRRLPANTHLPVKSTAYYQQKLNDYKENRLSVRQILRVAKSYDGPAPHFLWAKAPRARPNDDDECFFEYCIRILSEKQLVEFLRALVRNNPRLPALKRHGKSFLSIALLHKPPVSSEVLLLLCAPELTRDTITFGNTPLHMACQIRRADPYLINGLIDLDPDALMLPNKRSSLPLHHALVHNPKSRAIARMAHERPDTLLCRDRAGRTPIEDALHFAAHSPQLAATLRVLVTLRPRSVVPPHRVKPALHNACERFHAYPDLIEAIVRGHPPALCIASKPGRLLPFEAPTKPPGSVVPAFVAKETLHMSLAVVEFVMGSAAFSEDDKDAAWFQKHVRTTVAKFLPAQFLAGTSGFTVARAISKLEHATALALVRALFCHDRVVDLLRLKNEVFRDVVMGKAVVDLYLLNRIGRFDDDDMLTEPKENRVASRKGRDTVKPKDCDSTKRQDCNSVKLQDCNKVKLQDSNNVKPNDSSTVKLKDFDTVKKDGDTAEPKEGDAVKPNDIDTAKPKNCDTAKPMYLPVLEVARRVFSWMVSAGNEATGSGPEHDGARSPRG